MNALKTRRQAPETIGHSKAAPTLRVASDEDSATASQAIALQTYLEAEFAEPNGPRRWPLAISLPLIAAVSAGLWVAILAGARAVFS